MNFPLDKHLKNGIYGLTEDIKVLDVGYDPEKKQKEIKEFCEKYPDYVVCDPYEVNYLMLLSQIPNKLDMRLDCIGDGFNYGANCIINTHDFKRILIMAEND